MRHVEFNLLENLLYEWGIWVNQGDNRGRLGFSLASAFMGGAGGGGRKSLLSDDDAMLVCDEMAKLKKWNAELFDVVDWYYRCGLSRVKISQRMGVDRRHVNSLLQGGAIFVARGVMDWKIDLGGRLSRSAR